MVKWLHKLLFVTIAFSFFISATEMNIGEVENTFFDEYDTYVKTEQVSIDHAEIKQIQQQELWQIVSFIYYCFNPIRENQSSPKPQHIACNASPPKLFLRNSVWRI